MPPNAHTIRLQMQVDWKEHELVVATTNEPNCFDHPHLQYDPDVWMIRHCRSVGSTTSNKPNDDLSQVLRLVAVAS